MSPRCPTPDCAAWERALARVGAVVELNEKWRCPNRAAAMALAAAGVPLVAGTDSHRAGNLGRREFVRRVGHGLLTDDPIPMSKQ